MKKRGSIFDKVLVAIFLMSLCVLLIPAIRRGNTMKANMKASRVMLAEKMDSTPHPIPFGHNIFYFSETGTNFPRALATWLDIHTNLEIAAIAPDVTKQNYKDPNDTRFSYSDYGATIGYNVVFREKR